MNLWEPGLNSFSLFSHCNHLFNTLLPQMQTRHDPYLQGAQNFNLEACCENWSGQGEGIGVMADPRDSGRTSGQSPRMTFYC